MKVLMFGWEFPPHISGGLGTACFGLTKGLSLQDDLEITFVVPKAWGDEKSPGISLIGANTIQIKKYNVGFSDKAKKMQFIEVNSAIVPYTDPDEYYKLRDKTLSDQYKTVQITQEGTVPFTGKYGPNLMDEINRYAIVAEVIAREFSFDLIHAHDWLTYPAGIAAKKVSNKPLIVHVHATEFDRSRGNINPVVYDIEREGMNAAEHIISVSNLTRNIVIEKYHIEPGKITTVYNAVEPLEKTEKLHFKTEKDEKLVTFLGRITMQKGPEYFVEAACKVLKRTHNVRFVMAGSGDMMHKMISMVAARKMGNRFHFTGFLTGDEVFELLSMSDVYIMPSVSEPFGISPLEAIQSDVPVIISKQSGVAEVITHAFKVDYWDIDAMADAIYGLTQYPALGNTFRSLSRTEIQFIKWENAAKRVREIYNNVINLQ
jgi:glycogen synthase